MENRVHPSIAILLISFVYANAIPLQVQNHVNSLQREEYVPLLAKLLNRYLENSGNIETVGNSIEGVALPTLSAHGFVSFPEVTFEKTDKLSNLRTFPNVLPDNFNKSNVRPMFERFAKRNIDEIDRTAFDSFYKRNFDEIDRVGWSGFVKRLSNYINKQSQR